MIAPGAVVSARISAGKVSIAGAFTGEVTARERVELMPTARVQCTINTPSFVLNEGAQFDGDCKMPNEEDRGVAGRARATAPPIHFI